MARFSGKIGFAHTQEKIDRYGNATGIWEEQITERRYIGDVLTSGRRSSDEAINDTLHITNRISIVADAYLNENLFALRYVEFMGCKWKVSSIDVQRPRLIISLGGVYTDVE